MVPPADKPAQLSVNRAFVVQIRSDTAVLQGRLAGRSAIGSHARPRVTEGGRGSSGSGAFGQGAISGATWMTPVEELPAKRSKVIKEKNSSFTSRLGRRPSSVTTDVSRPWHYARLADGMT
jgi:hypothetical protein